MDYDTTEFLYERPNESGFVIYPPMKEQGLPLYEIYTNDGRGNGDFICSTYDYNWARRIANALDSVSKEIK